MPEAAPINQVPGAPQFTLTPKLHADLQVLNHLRPIGMTRAGRHAIGAIPREG